MRRIICISLLAACSGEPADGPAKDDTGELPEPDPTGAVALTDANNYTFSGTLDAPSFPVAPETDVSLEWSGLTTNLRCQDLDPVADIDNTALLYFPYLTEAEIEHGLSTDTLDQADLGVYLSYEPGDTTSVSLSQVSFFGTDPEIEGQFTADSGTWLVLLTTGTTVAVGVQMLAFLEPTAGETTTVASLTDGCSVLDYSADLASAARVPVLAGGPWLLDWSALTRDGQGSPFEPTRADALMVARFDESITDLEADFLDLELLAEETWTYTLTGGTTADLGALSGPSDPFPGFTTAGTWALALRCTTCPNPAPLFLTFVVPS